MVLTLDHSAGVGIVIAMASSHGLPLDRLRVGWCGGEPAPIDNQTSRCSLGRGTVVTATVQIWVPLTDTPWGAIGGLWVSGEHVEPIDLYRSLP